MSTGRNTTARDKHRRIIAKGKPPCHLCGQPTDYDLPHLDPYEYVVDRVIPLVKGGPDDLFLPDGTPQKLAAHRCCNRAKSDRLEVDQVRHFVTNLTWS